MISLLCNLRVQNTLGNVIIEYYEGLQWTLESNICANTTVLSLKNRRAMVNPWQFCVDEIVHSFIRIYKATSDEIWGQLETFDVMPRPMYQRTRMWNMITSPATPTVCQMFKVATWHYRCRHHLKNNCIWDHLQCCLLFCGCIYISNWTTVQ